MRDKCAGCIFEDSIPYEDIDIPTCSREDDFIESANARRDTEPCPWYISKKKIIQLQDEGYLLKEFYVDNRMDELHITLEKGV